MIYFVKKISNLPIECKLLDYWYVNYFSLIIKIFSTNSLSFICVIDTCYK